MKTRNQLLSFALVCCLSFVSFNTNANAKLIALGDAMGNNSYKASSTINLTSSSSSSVFGQSVTFTATVTASGSTGSPTGTVTFFDGEISLGGVGLTQEGATLTTSNLSVGSHTIRATYSGDNTYNGSTTVSEGILTVRNSTQLGAATTITVTSSTPQAVFGQPITFTATVTASSAGASATPTGTVTFFDGKVGAGTLELSSSQAILTTTNLTVGSHSITAVYNGDANFATSTSSALTQTIVQSGAELQLGTNSTIGVDSSCSDIKLQLENAIKNSDTSGNNYLRLKLTYTSQCTEFTPVTERCAQLNQELQTHISVGDFNADGRAEYLKSCQKPILPAVFEDDVLVSFEQKNNPFSDITITKLNGKAALELYRRGVIGGFSNGTFGGEQLVNRAQAAKFLLLAKYGVVITSSGALQFKDTIKGEWYVKYIERASILGIIKGYSDGNFRPASSVNTAEFLKMLALTFNIKTDVQNTYTDVKSTDWFAVYAGIAAKYNLFPDRTDGRLLPGKLLTRNEVAIAIYQYLANR